MLKVDATQGEFGPNVPFVDGVYPPAYRRDAVEQDGHPPRSSPRLQVLEILRRREIRAGRRRADRGKGPWIIKPKRHRGTSLETGKYPDLNPAALLIEIPREDYAGLHHGKDVLARCHRPVDVCPGLADVKVGKLVPASAVRQCGDLL